MLSSKTVEPHKSMIPNAEIDFCSGRRGKEEKKYDVYFYKFLSLCLAKEEKNVFKTSTKGNLMANLHNA